jgi:methionine salvage enolase-phosphatase E1
MTDKQPIQGLMHALYVTDIFGTTTPFSHVKYDIVDYINHPQVMAQISEITGLEDIGGIVEKGMAKAVEGEKDHPDFKQYLKVSELAATLGYSSRELTMPLESDVEPTLADIRRMGGKVHVFSSGNNECSQTGMQTNGLDDMIDSYHSSSEEEIGSKFSSDAYKAIAQRAGVEVSNMVYVTDTPKEATAAVEAGVGKVFLIDRTAEIQDKEGYTIINDYHQVLEQTVKEI